MKVTKQFFPFALSILTVWACSESGDPASPNSSQACLITKYLRSTESYIYTHNSSGQIAESIFSYSSFQVGYKTEYATDQVKISSASLTNNTSPTYKLMATYKVNSSGLPISKKDINGNITIRYLYDGSKLSYYVEYFYATGTSLVGGQKDSVVMSYDQTGKNIAKEKYYRYSYNTKTWVAGLTNEYVYDAKSNPFFNLWGAKDEDLQVPEFFSQNNISIDEDHTTIVYNYNPQNYPVLRTESGTKGVISTYEYLCK